MTCYAFVSEIGPPRTVLAEVSVAVARPVVCRENAHSESGLTLFEEIVLRVLQRFPDAYRAVMEESREFRREGDDP